MDEAVSSGARPHWEVSESLKSPWLEDAYIEIEWASVIRHMSGPGLFVRLEESGEEAFMDMVSVDDLAAILQSHFVRRYGNLLLLMKVSNALRVSSKWARCRLLMDFLPSPQTRSMGFLLGL